MFLTSLKKIGTFLQKLISSIAPIKVSLDRYAEMEPISSENVLYVCSLAFYVVFSSFHWILCIETYDYEKLNPVILPPTPGVFLGRFAISLKC